MSKVYFWQCHFLCPLCSMAECLCIVMAYLYSSTLWSSWFRGYHFASYWGQPTCMLPSIVSWWNDLVCMRVCVCACALMLSKFLHALHFFPQCVLFITSCWTSGRFQLLVSVLLAILHHFFSAKNFAIVSCSFIPFLPHLPPPSLPVPSLSFFLLCITVLLVVCTLSVFLYTLASISVYNFCCCLVYVFVVVLFQRGKDWLVFPLEHMHRIWCGSPFVPGSESRGTQLRQLCLSFDLGRPYQHGLGHFSPSCGYRPLLAPSLVRTYLSVRVYCQYTCHCCYTSDSYCML